MAGQPLEMALDSVVLSGEPARRHLARRLALLLLIMTIFLDSSIVLVEVVTAVFEPARFWEISLQPGRIIHLGAAVVTTVAWIVCRRADLSLAALRRLDVAAMVGWCGLFALDLGTNDPTTRPELLLVLLLTNALIVRAALVPSTPRRSLGLALFATVAALASTYAVHGWGLAVGSAVQPLSITAFFMSMTVAGTTLVSRVIYGLRERASQAVRLGQYVLEEKLGEGGMGVVYRASHAMLKRPTAVKLLVPEKATPTFIARFEREVQLTARLTHPNTIAIYDYGRTASGVFYYAMEYLDGLGLDALVELDGPQPPARVVHILRQILGALAEAHGVDLIHRDIKPANIMLCQRGGDSDVVKVLDFGLVKRLAYEDVKLSREDTIMGTPLYTAPEAVTAPDRVDGRADLYAVAAVGYYLLTGTHVFGGRSAVEVLGHHLHTAPEPIAERLGRAAAPALEAVLLRCLAKDPGERPASAAELAGELERCGLVWTRAEAERWWAASAEARKGAGPRGPRLPATLTVDIAMLPTHAGP